jgi:Fe-S-cluster containining protein
MAASSDDQHMVTGELTLDCDAWKLQCSVTVPTGPSTLDDLLPLARILSDSVVAATVNAVENTGAAISCKAGCGACCRNLVAISEVEARRIATVIDQMPEPRQSVVRERYEDARRRLEQSGILSRLQDRDRLTDDEYLVLCTEYFHLQIACPLLEDESCSIYNERPITCREYLVVSPPEHCSHPTAETVQRVNIPLPVFNAVARWQMPPGEHLLERWVPLVIAPEWAATHPDDIPPKPGVELLRELLNLLTQKPTAEPAPIAPPPR